ncbi:hypothetical protein [Parasphingorhabdus cellanae]|uniref:Tetratricopeptide repeat protein n=1 Tax=Parasphingorhabdus cellanae TaxID=2806553 RepID=A0ABX7T7Q4_9SPHN|nr:hypothetical protein [Parasphingorhabdus cellanae]QTD56812.1 hypothetical protein J4G78_04350 [Parasphingorhabdus cellanae]
MNQILSLIKAGSVGLTALCLATTAQAETLQIDGLYPARVDNIAEIKSIAIDRFGGDDGIALAFAIEDKLSDVKIDGASYFKIMAGRSAIQPEATLSGTATAGIEEFPTTGYRDRCVKRDDKGKCKKRKSIEVSCLKRVIDFQAQIRLSRFRDGQTIYSERKSNGHEQTVCGRKESFSSSEAIIRGMISSAAYSVRRDLAPIERQQKIRVFESRKAMDKATANLFKAAVKMTKTDEREACRMWDQAAMNSAPHRSIAFNRALCAEQEGALEKAVTLYSQAGQLAGGKTEISQAIRRVEDRQRAMDDWDIRYASTEMMSEALATAEAD